MAAFWKTCALDLKHMSDDETNIMEIEVTVPGTYGNFYGPFRVVSKFVLCLDVFKSRKVCKIGRKSSSFFPPPFNDW